MILYTCAYIVHLITFLQIESLPQMAFIIAEILKIYHKLVTNSIP